MKRYPTKKDQEDLKKEAIQLFGCALKRVQVFVDEKDPFNPRNRITGVICRDDGPFYGSLLIAQVNEVIVEHQIIYGFPKILPLPPRPPTNPPPVSFYLAQKWNGLNITFFKYYDATGKCFISAKTRGYVFARDYPGGRVFSNTLRVLGLSAEPDLGIDGGPVFKKDGLPTLLEDLGNPSIASMSFELCGSDEPSLVRYDFPIALKPLVATDLQGRIRPIVSSDSLSPFIPAFLEGMKFDLPLQRRISLLESDFGPRSFSSKLSEPENKFPEGKAGDITEIRYIIQNYTDLALEINKAYRAEKGLTEDAYYFDSFALEGRVLYLLDSDGFALSRGHIFKLKPKDVADFHSPQFDLHVQNRVLEAVRKIFEKGHPAVSQELLMQELDFSELHWGILGKDVFSFAQPISNVFSTSIEASVQKMIVLVGKPGSGKSTFAAKLLESTHTSIWYRVNQDEMKTRAACEENARMAFKKGFSVIVDRCNFDLAQRHSWIAVAHEFGVNDIWCVYLDTDTDVCKHRVVNREGHPTIPKGESGASVVEKFDTLIVNPRQEEGFRQILVIKTDHEHEEALDRLKSLVIIGDPDSENGWNKTDSTKNAKFGHALNRSMEKKKTKGRGRVEADDSQESKDDAVAFNRYEVLDS